MKSLRSLAFVAVSLFLWPETAWAQCALCREAVASSSQKTREAMNHAVIALAFAPYLTALLAIWVGSPALRGRVRDWFKKRATRGGTEGSR